MYKFIINNTRFFLGKNDIENTNLVKKYMSQNFVWMHLNDLPSGHLIIEKPIEKINDDEINICSNIIKFYTKHRNDWTNKFYVDIVSTYNVIPLDKPGLVSIKNCRVKKIEFIENFKINYYKYYEFQSDYDEVMNFIRLMEKKDKVYKFKIDKIINHENKILWLERINHFLKTLNLKNINDGIIKKIIMCPYKDLNIKKNVTIRQKDGYILFIID